MQNSPDFCGDTRMQQTAELLGLGFAYACILLWLTTTAFHFWILKIRIDRGDVGPRNSDTVFELYATLTPLPALYDNVVCDIFRVLGALMLLKGLHDRDPLLLMYWVRYKVVEIFTAVIMLFLRILLRDMTWVLLFYSVISLSINFCLFYVIWVNTIMAKEC